MHQVHCAQLPETQSVSPVAGGATWDQSYLVCLLYRVSSALSIVECGEKLASCSLYFTLYRLWVWVAGNNEEIGCAKKKYQISAVQHAEYYAQFYWAQRSMIWPVLSNQAEGDKFIFTVCGGSNSMTWGQTVHPVLCMSYSTLSRGRQQQFPRWDLVILIFVIHTKRLHLKQ